MTLSALILTAVLDSNQAARQYARGAEKVARDTLEILAREILANSPDAEPKPCESSESS